MGYQKWLCNFVQIEYRRVFNIPVPELPGCTADPALVFFSPSRIDCRPIFLQQAISAEQVANSRSHYCSLKPRCLSNQRKSRVSPIAVPHDAKPVRIGNAKINHLLYTGQDGLCEISHWRPNL